MKKILALALLPLFCISCSVVRTTVDAPARFLGVSTQKFFAQDTSKVEKTIELSKQNAYKKTLEIIANLRGRITHQSVSKGYIVAFDWAKSFDYCLDSTEAGFFFEEIDANNTKISVISNNTPLTNILAERYFELITK